MEGRVVLDQVGTTFNSDCRRSLDHAELDRENDWHDGVYVDGLVGCSESLHRRGDTVGIEGNVVETELAGGVGFCGAFVSAYMIGYLHAGTWNYCSTGIAEGARDSSRVTLESVCKGDKCADECKGEKSKKNRPAHRGKLLSSSMSISADVRGAAGNTLRDR